MFVLSCEQKTHSEALYNTLLQHSIAYDTSSTGSGKTIVAIKLAKRLNINVVVFGAPILKDNWDKTAKIEKIQSYKFTSIFQRKITLDKAPHFVILDECQVIKNICARTKLFVQELFRNKDVKYILMLSATPFDHPRHIPLVENILGARFQNACTTALFNDLKFGMNFKYQTKLTYELYHIMMTKNEEKEYVTARCKIYSAKVRENDNDFQPHLFSAGLKQLHQSLFNGLIRCVNSSKYPKKIVVLKYQDDFVRFCKYFPNALVINGSVPQILRSQIIERFQKTDAPLLAITDVIGGVGIDLDDQVGDAPRHIISMPLFAADFVQLAGRTRRRNTKSDSKITIIQPKNMKKTYFKSQIQIKLPILSMFNETVEFMKTPYITGEHDKNCDEYKDILLAYLPKDIVQVIISFECACFNF